MLALHSHPSSLTRRQSKLIALTCFLMAISGGGVRGGSSTYGSSASAESSVVVEDCRSLSGEGRFAEAIPLCSAELAAAKAKEGKEEERAELLLLRATALAAENQAQKALVDFNSAIAFKSCPGAHLGRAKLYLRQGRFTEATEDAGKAGAEGKALVKRIERIQARLQEAEGLLRERKTEAAGKLLETLQLEEGVDLSARVYGMRAECLAAAGRLQDAIRMYQGRATLESESSETEFQVGKLYLAMGNLERGRKLVDSCARNNHDHAPSHALRRRLKAISSTIEEADSMLLKQAVAALEAALQQIQAVDPSEAFYDPNLPTLLSAPFELPLLSLLCSKHIRLKQSDLAIRRCERVMELLSAAPSISSSSTERENAHLQMGEAYAQAGRYQDAINVYRAAQKAFPRSPRLSEALQKAHRDAKEAARRDYYKIIGVPRDASEAEIRRAYNKAARRWHPDKVGPDEALQAEAKAKMQDLNAALGVLTDKKKRAQFDAGIDPENPQEASDPFAGHGGFRQHGGGGFGGFGGPGGGGGFNFEDLFRQHHHQQQQQRRGGGGGGHHHYRQQQQRRGGGGGGGVNFEDFFKFDL